MIVNGKLKMLPPTSGRTSNDVAARDDQTQLLVDDNAAAPGAAVLDKNCRNVAGHKFSVVGRQNVACICVRNLVTNAR